MPKYAFYFHQAGAEISFAVAQSAIYSLRAVKKTIDLFQEHHEQTKRVRSLVADRHENKDRANRLVSEYPFRVLMVGGLNPNRVIPSA